MISLFLRRIIRSSIIISPLLLIGACSSGGQHDERLGLTAPSYATSGPGNVAYRQPDRRRFNDDRYGARGDCMTETTARRPFPSYITVRRGDNLCRIAKRYETTIQAIVDVNRLPSPILSIGSRLDLPSPAYYASSPYGPLMRR